MVTSERKKKKKKGDLQSIVTPFKTPKLTIYLPKIKLFAKEKKKNPTRLYHLELVKNERRF